MVRHEKQQSTPEAGKKIYFYILTFTAGAGNNLPGNFSARSPVGDVTLQTLECIPQL